MAKAKFYRENSGHEESITTIDFPIVDVLGNYVPTIRAMFCPLSKIIEWKKNEKIIKTIPAYYSCCSVSTTKFERSFGTEQELIDGFVKQGFTAKKLLHPLELWT